MSDARGFGWRQSGLVWWPLGVLTFALDQFTKELIQRLMVFGHSAGGHLSACMLATDWKKFDPKAPLDLVPAAYSIPACSTFRR